jgi:hypothetical protein
MKNNKSTDIFGLPLIFFIYHPVFLVFDFLKKNPKPASRVSAALSKKSEGQSDTKSA